MMKYFSLIVLALILSGVSSCNKNDYPVPSAQIVGKWRWVKSVGGIGGFTLTPASEGFTQTQVFGADSSFKFYKNDSLKVQTTFSVLKNYKQGTETVDILKINNTDWYKAAFTIRNDTLYTSDALFISDGFSTVYVRVK